MAPTRTARPSREDGFGLIEMIIVLVILSILMAVAIPMFGGSRRTASKKAAITAAGAYSQALSRYAVDQAGRYPAGIGTAGWPSAVTGPVDTRMPTARPYLSGSQRPENVYQAGTTAGNQQNAIAIGPAGATRSTDGFLIRYIPPTAGAPKPEFRLEVIERRDGTLRPVCAYGNQTVAGTPSC